MRPLRFFSLASARSLSLAAITCCAHGALVEKARCHTASPLRFTQISFRSVASCRRPLFFPTVAPPGAARPHVAHPYPRLYAVRRSGTHQGAGQGARERTEAGHAAAIFFFHPLAMKGEHGERAQANNSACCATERPLTHRQREREKRERERKGPSSGRCLSRLCLSSHFSSHTLFPARFARTAPLLPLRALRCATPAAPLPPAASPATNGDRWRKPRQRYVSASLLGGGGADRTRAAAVETAVHLWRAGRARGERKETRADRETRCVRRRCCNSCRLLVRPRQPGASHERTQAHAHAPLSAMPPTTLSHASSLPLPPPYSLSLTRAPPRLVAMAVCRPLETSDGLHQRDG